MIGVVIDAMREIGSGAIGAALAVQRPDCGDLFPISRSSALLIGGLFRT